MVFFYVQYSKFVKFTFYGLKKTGLYFETVKKKKVKSKNVFWLILDAGLIRHQLAIWLD